MSWNETVGIARFFIDGLFIGETNLGSITSSNFAFGHSTNTAADNFMNGLLGEVRIYSAWMDDAAVLELHQSFNKSALFSMTASVSKTNTDNLDQLTYTTTITNDLTTTLANFTLTAPGLTFVSCDTIQPNTNAVLGLNETVTCTFTYSVTQADLNAGQDLVFTINAGFCDGNVFDSKELRTTITQIITANVTKTGPASIDNPGDQITWTVVVTNTGNIDLPNFQYTDIFEGNSQTLTCDNVQPGGTLTVGSTNTCVLNYTVTQTDFNTRSQLVNNVTVTFSRSMETKRGNVQQDILLSQSAESIVLLNRRFTFELIKSVNVTVTDVVGEVLGYNITLNNTGNVDLMAFNYSDPYLGTLDCTVNGGSIVSNTLFTGEVIICLGAYQTTQNDFNTRDNVTNEVWANFETDNVTVSGYATAITNLTRYWRFNVTKSANPTITATCNDTISYEITITNTGNTDLEGLNISDFLITLQCSTENTTLLNGASVTCTGQYQTTPSDFALRPLLHNVVEVTFTTQNLHDSASVTTELVNVYGLPQNFTGPFCLYDDWLASGGFSCTACGAQVVKVWEYCNQPSPLKYGARFTTGPTSIGSATFTVGEDYSATCDCTPPPACVPPTGEQLQRFSRLTRKE